MVWPSKTGRMKSENSTYQDLGHFLTQMLARVFHIFSTAPCSTIVVQP